jgi:hypothetical protein
MRSHLAIPFIQSWNTRSLLATSFDQYRNTRSLLAISNSLESHLAIPFIQYEIWGPFWRPPLTNIEIRDPFWRSQTTWNPIWRFLLFEAEIMRSLLAISFNQKPKNLFCKSVNLESHLAIPFNRLLDVVLPDGRVWKLLSSLLVVLESTQWFFLRPQSCLECTKVSSCNNPKNIYAMIYD